MSGQRGMRNGAKAHMGWWYRATDAERLAQIDGGIECGMTAREVALNCGGNIGTVMDFGKDHGRKWLSIGNTAFYQRERSIQTVRKSYLSGEPVSFWAA